MAQNIHIFFKIFFKPTYDASKECTKIHSLTNTDQNEQTILRAIGRNSLSPIFFKKLVLENFAKFPEKHLLGTLIKEILQQGCFRVRFANFFRTVIL